jgi:hypothetical protein
MQHEPGCNYLIDNPGHNSPPFSLVSATMHPKSQQFSSITHITSAQTTTSYCSLHTLLTIRIAYLHICSRLSDTPKQIRRHRACPGLSTAPHRTDQAPSSRIDISNRAITCLRGAYRLTSSWQPSLHQVASCRVVPTSRSTSCLFRTVDATPRVSSEPFDVTAHVSPKTSDMSSRYPPIFADIPSHCPSLSVDMLVCDPSRFLLTTIQDLSMQHSRPASFEAFGPAQLSSTTPDMRYHFDPLVRA